MARTDERTTEFGSPSYVSQERSRNADHTKTAVDSTFDAEDFAHIDAAVEATTDREFICIDRQVGRHPALSFVCRYFVPVEYARIALAWANLLDPAPDRPEPSFYTVQVPDHDEVAIRVLPDEGFTAVLGSDYTGEAKKSFLRLFMYEAKQQGGLGLHAGSKRIELEDDTIGQLFLGLSATGKTTLTCHGYELEPPEEARLVQDDVCALLPDGTVAGSEGHGLYIKTHGLDGDEQPALYEAATAERAVFENVDVDPDGTVDFDSDRFTANGRAVVNRHDVDGTSESIDLEGVDQIFFITRNPLMPPVAKLSPAEAAAAFMLGESIETSAGDPSRAGESIRVVGTNPFIIGPPAEEGNRFRRLVEELGVECFLLNTGTVGGEHDIGVSDTVAIVRSIARGMLEWQSDETTGLQVPTAVNGVDLERFDIGQVVDDYGDQLTALKLERREYLEAFDGLDQSIIDAVY